MKITSLQNPGLKAALALREKRARRKTRTFLVEGGREIARACAGGFRLEKLFFCPPFFSQETQAIWASLRSEGEAGWQSIELDEKCFNKLAVREESEGLIAVAAEKASSLNELRLGKRPLLIAVEAVEKPGNLGALLRSADGAGADAVVVLEQSLDPFHPQVIRTSLGAVFAKPVIMASNTDFRDFCRRHRLQIVSCFLGKQSRLYTEADLNGATAILLGNEATGLSTFWQAESDAFVQIPMLGIADSLNVSVAGALLLYEAQRQRALVDRAKGT